MTVNDAEDKQSKVGRRSLLRGGAVIAGAGLAGTALAQPASAAPVEYVKLGAGNAETTSTGLTVNGSTGDPAVPALGLGNADGPSLYLAPLDDSWAGDLKIGEIANTSDGPLIGVHDPSGEDQTAVTTSFLVTGIDLGLIPTPVAVPPTRLLDTRTAAGRKGILATSDNAFDADFRLRKGAFIDFLVSPTSDGYALSGIFLNLTAVAATANGYVAVYPGPENPGTSTLNVSPGQTVANSAFVAVRVLTDYYAVRVYASAPCWLVVDLSGGVVQEYFTESVGRRAASSRASITKKLMAKVGRRR